MNEWTLTKNNRIVSQKPFVFTKSWYTVVHDGVGVWNYSAAAAGKVGKTRFYRYSHALRNNLRECSRVPVSGRGGIQWHDMPYHRLCNSSNMA